MRPARPPLRVRPMVGVSVMACLRSGSGAVATLEPTQLVDGDVAADGVARLDLVVRRLRGVAQPLDEPVAASVEHAAAGWVGRRGDLAREVDPQVGLAVDARY